MRHSDCKLLYNDIVTFSDLCTDFLNLSIVLLISSLYTYSIVKPLSFYNFCSQYSKFRNIAQEKYFSTLKRK